MSPTCLGFVILNYFFLFDKRIKIPEIEFFAGFLKLGLSKSTLRNIGYRVFDPKNTYMAWSDKNRHRENASDIGPVLEIGNTLKKFQPNFYSNF